MTVRVSAREVAGYDLEAIAERLRDVADAHGLDGAPVQRTAERLPPADREAVLELAERVADLSRRLRGIAR